MINSKKDKKLKQLDSYRNSHESITIETVHSELINNHVYLYKILLERS